MLWSKLNRCNTIINDEVYDSVTVFRPLHRAAGYLIIIDDGIVQILQCSRWSRSFNIVVKPIRFHGWLTRRCSWPHRDSCGTSIDNWYSETNKYIILGIKLLQIERLTRWILNWTHTYVGYSVVYFNVSTENICQSYSVLTWNMI